MNWRIAGSAAVRQLSFRLFSTSTVRTLAGEPLQRLVRRSLGIGTGTPAQSGGAWIWIPATGARSWSKLAPRVVRKEVTEDEKSEPGSAGGRAEPPKEDAVVSYWEVSPAKVVKEDGTEWKWNSFRGSVLKNSQQESDNEDNYSEECEG